jgi:hypothetical protein
VKIVHFLFTNRTLCVLLVSTNFFQIFEVEVSKIILPILILKFLWFLVKLWRSNQWPHFRHSILHQFSFKLCWFLCNLMSKIRSLFRAS